MPLDRFLVSEHLVLTMKITRVRLSDIKTDVSRFQFRSVPFDEERVQWIIANWNPNLLDPLDLWESPDGKYLLAGHHRLEALKRRGDSSAPCRLHELSLADAQLYALMSNANRLQYSSFEYCRCLEFLVSKGRSITEAGEQLALTDGMARKYHTLRQLKGTDWELQTDKLDLLSRAFEVGTFCETNTLTSSEIQSLFGIVTKHDLTASQLRQLLRDIRRQKAVKDNSSQSSLFDLDDFGDRTATALKERSFLDNCAAQAWWLYELVNKDSLHQFPEELKAPLMKELRRIYAHCIGSEDDEVVPVRATKNGRNLTTNYLDQKSRGAEENRGRGENTNPLQGGTSL